MIFDTLKQALPAAQQDVLMADHTTFKIGGPAEYFFIAKRKEELIKAIEIGKELQLPIFVFGGGSNLLVTDDGLKGLVIKLHNEDGMIIEGEQVMAPAGIDMRHVVHATVEASLEGLEWAGGLPGTFGGAIRGNAGAFGGEMKDSILSVQALDHSLSLRTFVGKECHFSYRSSIFKEKNWIVVSAVLGLKKGDKEKLKEIVRSRQEYRKERHPLDYPNAGSIFKNVALKDFSPALQSDLLPVVKKDPFEVVPTAYLLSELGLKGTTIGGAQISPKHPNFIVNIGGAKAKDVLALVDLVKKKVKEIYGVDLEMEVQYVEK